MVRPEVGEYQRLALVGLEADADELFKGMFLEVFPGMEFVEREAVLGILSEEDFRSGRVVSDARDRLRESLGVHGVLALIWEDSSMGGTLDWRLTITNTETSQTTGTVVAKVRREPLARGASFDDLEKRAFESLISVLDGRLNR